MLIIYIKFRNFKEGFYKTVDIIKLASNGSPIIIAAITSFRSRFQLDDYGLK